MTLTSITGLIPARGGSKSVPRKNIRDVAGKPLIAWTIEAAKEAGCFNRLITTTDDEEIADIAKRYGSETPFLRPKALSKDDTPGIAPLLHALSWLAQQENYHPEWVMLLQPTSPLREAKHILAAVRLAIKRQADAVVSVYPVSQHPYWMKKIVGDGKVSNFIETKDAYADRQSLPKAYITNGAIYLIRSSVALREKTFYTKKTYAYLMSPECSLDIDDPGDLYIADLVLRDKLKKPADSARLVS